MKSYYLKASRTCTLLAVFLFSFISKSQATHIYGADFFYTFVSGTTYNVTLVVYGDCSGSAFSNLSSASPTVELYNGSTLVSSQNLIIQAPTGGIEVTPVCASQLSNTNCTNVNNPIPGVKKFTYSRAFTVGSASANWKFLFTGAMGFTSAGRSNSITNIAVGVNGSVMQLEATLNNLTAGNSSPVYTTIPTPFFCINKAANYNPGTVDPNADSLAYTLVPGLDQLAGTVTYNTGYSATAPLAVATSSFSFSGTTGQLGFTPNLVQRSLVVTRVTEYRNGVVVGTSMREMTFVVLNNCNNNAPRGSISNASGGTIVDTVTYKACQSSGSVSFSINPIDPDNDTINVAYSGLPTGATFTINNNNTLAPTGSFNWNITNVAAGTYTFFITYTDNGCPLSSKQTQAYSIIVLPNPTLSFVLVAPATCVRKAKFNMTPSGAPTPWTISIRQGSTTLVSYPGLTSTKLDSLSPGTYIFRVTNANGCFKDTTITIAPPPAIIPSVAMIQPTCNGGNNGSITITASGGAPPFSYALGSGAYSVVNVFTGLTAGTYTLHIKDTNLCIKDTTVQLLQPAAITANITFVRPPCNYFNSGLITVTASNGTAPYQYAIGTGSFSTTNTFTGLFSGTYVLHIKDANNCTKDTTFLLQDSIVVHATAAVTNILCYGDTTGAITLTAFGGTSPYQYQKGTGVLSNNNTFPNLPAGTYSFHIQDTNRCYLDTQVTVTQPPLITTTSAVVHVLCNGNATGSITITATGGVTPYTYAKDAGAYGATNAFNGLTAGTYTLHVKDANGCIKDTTITITQPTPLVIISVNKNDANCNGSSDGVASLAATGGVTPYTFAIGSGSYGSSATFSGLVAGTYILHVRDANGCTKDTSVTIGQPTPIVPTAQVRNSTCTPLNNGQVILGASGGSPGYQYSVFSTAYTASPVFSGLATNLYVFHIRDTHGCIKDTAITINDSLKVTATINVTNARCFNESSGAISVTPGGGVSPYTYSIGTNPFGTPNTFTSLAAGNYIIHVKDNLGCIKDTTPVTVTEPTIIVPVVLGITMPTCYGFSNGIVFLSANGGTPGYTYAIGTGAYSATSSFTGLAAGTYTFHVKDANNCTHDTTVTVGQPTPLALTVNVTDVVCFGEKSGTVTVNGTGGTPSYTYAFDGNAYQAGSTLTGINVGTHLIRLKDQNGCTKDTNVTLTEPPVLLIDKITVTHPTCEGFTDAAINISGKGGTPGYEYRVGSDAFTANGNFTGLKEGSYILRLKDRHNCIVDSTVTLIGYPHINIDDILPDDVSCYDYKDGKITINASGGMPPLWYKIGDGLLSNNNIFDGLKAGTYKLTVVDSKNCKKDTTTVIGSPEIIALKIKATPNDCEGYDNSGTVTVEVTGGTNPYYYKWSTNPPATSSQISGVANGKYWVWVKDDHECADSAKTDVLYDNCCKMFIPDAFTPNGDGLNDVIRMRQKGDFTLKIFSIYNRFGQRVFTTGNIADGWDGFFNGEPQDLGTYNYYVKGICGNGGTNEVEYKGTITLIK